MTECGDSLKRDRSRFFLSSLQLTCRNIEPLLGMNEEGSQRKRSIRERSWREYKRRKKESEGERERQQFAGLLVRNCQIGSKCPYGMNKNTQRFFRFIIDDNGELEILFHFSASYFVHMKFCSRYKMIPIKFCRPDDMIGFTAHTNGERKCGNSMELAVLRFQSARHVQRLRTGCCCCRCICL